MKNLLLIPLLAMLASCGAVNEMCGSDLRMGCNAIFGEKPTDHRDEIEKLQKKDSEQDETISELQSILDALENRLDYLTVELNDSQSLISNNSADISALTDLLAELEITQNSLEQRIEDAEGDIDALEHNDNISAVIRPCNDAKEVLLVLDSGSIIGYFETGNGNNRKAYLSLLDDGNYQTTDDTGCKFRIYTENGSRKVEER